MFSLSLIIYHSLQIDFHASFYIKIWILIGYVLCSGTINPLCMCVAIFSDSVILFFHQMQKYRAIVCYYIDRHCCKRMQVTVPNLVQWIVDDVTTVVAYFLFHGIFLVCLMKNIDNCWNRFSFDCWLSSFIVVRT